MAVITGNDDDETLNGSATNDIIKGAGGDDSLYGNNGNDKLYGMDGDDYLDGGYGGDEMYGGRDNDRYIVIEANDKVVEYAQEGNDYVFSYVDYTLPANVEQLQLAGTAANGNGNALDNLLFGNLYADTLAGGFGNDKLFGQHGDDVLIGGAGGDVLVGDEGIDTISYLSSFSAVLINLGNGMASGGDATGDTFDNATVENVTGSIYNDALFGSGLANVLNGSGGNDYLWGGLNADGFEFSFASAGWFGHDTVGDFTQGEDKIRLDDALFANFAAVQAKMGQAGTDTVISYDAGNSITLENITATSLQASDFVFI
jgi:Ca2+-binding RTX toxin-like protein